MDEAEFAPIDFPPPQRTAPAQLYLISPQEVGGSFSDRLKAALDQVQWSPLKCPVLSNVTAVLHDEAVPLIKQRLVEQLTSPVRWSASMQWAIANVKGQFVELAPGKVLSGLMRRIDKATKVENHAEPV